MIILDNFEESCSYTFRTRAGQFLRRSVFGKFHGSQCYFHLSGKYAEISILELILYIQICSQIQEELSYFQKITLSLVILSFNSLFSLTLHHHKPPPTPAKLPPELPPPTTTVTTPPPPRSDDLLSPLNGASRANSLCSSPCKLRASGLPPAASLHFPRPSPPCPSSSSDELFSWVNTHHLHLLPFSSVAPKACGAFRVSYPR
ncbi:unnamed protein product [Vicia faba]|uniref:Uncharacterized protein n=1 Tax=Vicia faba TaxID=3906 RepID=A0AAV1ANK9_VICFA|nr:unnamed protein product [Vicia faba]